MLQERALGLSALMGASCAGFTSTLLPLRSAPFMRSTAACRQTYDYLLDRGPQVLQAQGCSALVGMSALVGAPCAHSASTLLPLASMPCMRSTASCEQTQIPPYKSSQPLSGMLGPIQICLLTSEWCACQLWSASSDSKPLLTKSAPFMLSTAACNLKVHHSM